MGNGEAGKDEVTVCEGDVRGIDSAARPDWSRLELGIVARSGQPNPYIQRLLHAMARQRRAPLWKEASWSHSHAPRDLGWGQPP